MVGMARPLWSVFTGRGKEGAKNGRRMYLEQPHTWCLFLFKNLPKLVRINHHNKLLPDVS